MRHLGEIERLAEQVRRELSEAAECLGEQGGRLPDLADEAHEECASIAAWCAEMIEALEREEKTADDGPSPGVMMVVNQLAQQGASEQEILEALEGFGIKDPTVTLQRAMSHQMFAA